MRVIEQSVELMWPKNVTDVDLLKHLESAGRTCYKSEFKITNDSYLKFYEFISHHKHESVLEHISFTLRWITDRAILAELTRHRLASYSVESQRYVGYNDEEGHTNHITFVEPTHVKDEAYNAWYTSMEEAERSYLNMIKVGAKPQEARTVLPNSCKTDIVVTANLREWMHIFKLRCTPAAYPMIREITKMSLNILYKNFPLVFEKLYKEYCE